MRTVRETALDDGRRERGHLARSARIGQIKPSVNAEYGVQSGYCMIRIKRLTISPPNAAAGTWGAHPKQGYVALGKMIAKMKYARQAEIGGTG